MGLVLSQRAVRLSGCSCSLRLQRWYALPSKYKAKLPPQERGLTPPSSGPAYGRPLKSNVRSMSEARKTILDSAVLLAATTACLYCVGTAHYGGYLNVLQLDADVLNRDFNQTIYNGFLLSLAPAFILVAALAFGSWIYSHAIVPELNDLLRKSYHNRNAFLRVKHRLWGKRKDSPLELRHKRRTLRVSAGVLVAFGLILSLQQFEQKGKRDAQALQKKFVSASSLPAAEHILVKIDDRQYRLLFLACGARNCAGLDPKSQIVYYFPQNGHAYVPAKVAAKPASAASAP